MMAMTKEQQREAAERILAANPLTEEERKTFELMSKTPDQYIPPDEQTGQRTCGICGATFSAIPASKENPEVSSLERFADHLAEHNPSAVQWTEAHRSIQSSRSRPE